MTAARRDSLLQVGAFLVLALVMVFSLRTFDTGHSPQEKYDRLYFPSGKFLRESSLGFREANADYLWFRFVQYYGAFAKGYNNFRHFELLIDAITRLDPHFVEAYHFASLVTWSDLGKPYKSVDILKEGLLHNPHTARLYFQIGLIYYVVDHDYDRSSYWFTRASRCSDATDLERRFAAFSRYRGRNLLGSLQMWEELRETTDQPGMKKLAEKMISIIQEKMATGQQATET
ncbi:hypothetical protein CSA17_05145 [bacterium DOLJORAL78_65_58]|nr:MAG: hypothetical protein CSB20_13120 [bacterium DOLZORAL124_64_63]PIE75887.1 MAG: hypothetical protein CSA17_05145 [bacterium DOLJORAL78_65_58]